MRHREGDGRTTATPMTFVAAAPATAMAAATALFAGTAAVLRRAAGRLQDRPPRHVPPLPLQVNALQALCRQVLGFRMAMIVLAAPFALRGTASGLPLVLVGAAVLVTFMVSYALVRDWERFGPFLLRHPLLLGADMLVGSLLLVTASPDSTLAYVTICTPLLAGLVYGWRGAAVFAVLQALLLAGAYAVTGGVAKDHGFNVLLLPGLCVAAGAIGSSLRTFLLDLGEASQALGEARERLAAAGAVDEERARLARELHDSVAKTLQGLALAADGLAASSEAKDPETVRRGAELVARSARRAAAESRELLSDLRRVRMPGGADRVDLAAELTNRTRDFAALHGVRATFGPGLGTYPAPPLPHATARQVLGVVAEAMENAVRHGGGTRVAVSAGLSADGVLRISVYDDGRGLPPGTTLEDLRTAGHFGLVGMVERAAAIGARIRVGRGEAATGTEVRLELPLERDPGPPTGPPRPPLPGRPALPPLPPLPPLPALPAKEAEIHG
ncbi:sensor histidine kinase [Streptomyces sp. NBC_01497]|uniref:sensor histidine kinase n=1 Tax=Streptomyces sp. NBC_01497 TaxID=2903885 RepID=UPI002E2EE94C|nr:histidine kinase [Streptomyces sp. NBC_01497]